MKYQSAAFSLPTCQKPISQLEYDLRVGNITQEQYDLITAIRNTDAAAVANLENRTF